MKVPQSTRKYTPEEKAQLVKNLDIETEHRVRQLEEWLAVALDNFRLHQEVLISRIPKLVRNVTMGEFADKYNGDIQACLRGLQSERMGDTEFEIDKDTRKRKWAAAQEEAEASASGHAEEARATKNGERDPHRHQQPVHRSHQPIPPARLIAATPKRAGASTHPPPTPRTMARQPAPTPSPHKPKLPSLVPVRAVSPAKPNAVQRARPPSSATFNPTMPPRAPTYPTLRAPRHDENMLSVNGSPLANPYTLGLGWFAGDAVDEEAVPEGKGKVKEAPRTLRRVNSIIVRSQPASSGSQTAQTRTQPQPKPAPPPLAPSSSASALVSIPTQDGHLLEFDPLMTSPRALDKLIGITDSAKKHAKEEMTRLVKEAVRKWVIE